MMPNSTVVRSGCRQVLDGMSWLFESKPAVPIRLTQVQAVNHYTALNLTKLDVLDGFEKIKVAVAYKDPATGQEMDFFPADLSLLERCEVVVRSSRPLSRTCISVGMETCAYIGACLVQGVGGLEQAYHARQVVLRPAQAGACVH
jgi:hypothetical protein